MFLAPGQSMVPIADARELDAEADGWTLMFYADLIRRSPDRASQDASLGVGGFDQRDRLLLGFEHPQHFSKLFRSKTGMSPGEYRN